MSSAEKQPVLVTGGSSGLGAALVAALHEAGTPAVVLDKQAPPGPAADFRLVDVSDSAATEEAVRSLGDEHGLSGVVTAAGIDSCGPLTEVSTPDWERVVRVNLMGTAAVVRAAVPYLERVHGRVVTVASTLGLRPAGDATAYCAAKFGVVGFTRALAMELSGRVGVTLLIPGGMRTAFFDDRAEQYLPPDRGKLNPPEHVAATVVHVLNQPAGCEIRELVVCHESEPSWP